jgi:hypothetical protein
MEFNELKEYYKQVINEVIASDLPDSSVQRYAGMIHGILGRETPKARGGDIQAGTNLRRSSKILGALGYRTQTDTTPGRQGVYSTHTGENELNDILPPSLRPPRNEYIGSGNETAPLITHGYRGMRAGEAEAKSSRGLGGAQTRSKELRRNKAQDALAAKKAEAGGNIPFLFGNTK